MSKCALRLYSVLFFLISVLPSFGQYYYYNNKYYDNDLVFEFGGSVGGMNAITDLGGQEKKSKLYLNEINWRNTNGTAGVYFGALYQNVIGVRLEATWGTVSGYDSLLPKGNGRLSRNLSFRSPIRELSALLEFHPLMLKYYEEPPFLSPYVLAGVGWFSFNPQAKLNNNWVDLQPLRTEGQGFKEYPDRTPYRLAQSNLCVGLGVKYEVSQILNLRFEWVHRYLFTDYLDDVSTNYINPNLFSRYLTPTLSEQARQLNWRASAKQSRRGNDKDKDVYFSINFKAGVSLGRTRR